MLKCPKDQHNLKSASLKGVRIDECPKCGGKWFDRDELRIAKDSTDDDLRWLDFDLFDDNANKCKAHPSLKKCPKDSAKMTSLEYMDSKVTIEKCDACKGAWLDKGEFDKIIKYLENKVISEPASEYAKDVFKEFEEIFTGPESTISEIKDFFTVLRLFEIRLIVEHPWTADFYLKFYKYWPLK